MLPIELLIFAPNRRKGKRLLTLGNARVDYTHSLYTELFNDAKKLYYYNRDNMLKCLL